MNEPLVWNALEHEHIERNPDWFWMVGVVALGGAILALIFGNVLFALFIVVGAVTLCLYALKHPEVVRYEINSKGILVDATLYPYQTLESYCIHEHRHSYRLLIKSQKLFMPHIGVPMEDVPPEAVRAALSGHLPEVYVVMSTRQAGQERLETTRTLIERQRDAGAAVEVASTKKKVENIASFSDRKSARETLASVIEIIPAGVQLTTISWNKEATAVTFDMSGVAQTRSDLLAFGDALESSRLFTEVVIPIESLAPQANLRFTLALTLSTE